MSQPRAPATIEPLPLTPYRPWLRLSIVLKRLRINLEPYGMMNVFVDMWVLLPFIDIFFLSDGPLKTIDKVTVYLHGTHLLCAPYPILRLLWASSRDPRVRWTFKSRKHFVRNSSCYRDNHICLDTEPCPISDIQFCDLLQAIMKWEI
jgi:hypothetical protein